MGLGQRWRKDLTGLPRQVSDGGNNSAQPANHGVQSVHCHTLIQGLCVSIKKMG